LSENICAAVNRHNIEIVDVLGKVSQDHQLSANKALWWAPEPAPASLMMMDRFAE